PPLPIFPPEQVRPLLLGGKPSRYAPLFELLVNTGLRRGEALALHWSEIDFDAVAPGARHSRSRRRRARCDRNEGAEASPSDPLSPAAERLLRDIRANQRAERLRAGSMLEPPPHGITHKTREPWR